jgi:hypothetical protein
LTRPSVLKFIRYLGLEKKIKKYIYDNPDCPVSYWYDHTKLEDNRFETFMDGIIDAFEVNFDQAFDQWLTTDKDNYSTKDFLMFGRANDGAPSPKYVSCPLSNLKPGLFFLYSLLAWWFGC